MLDWLTDNKIPLGRWINGLVDFLNENVAWLFDFISDVLGFLINGFIDVLVWVHPLVLIVLLAGLSWWLHRSWRMSVMIVVALLLILNLGYWEPTMETLALVSDRDAGLHAGRGAGRHRRGAPAMALYRDPADPRSDADGPDLRLSDPDADPVRAGRGAGV